MLKIATGVGDGRKETGAGLWRMKSNAVRRKNTGK